jgi:preprotein translocase subunit SecE
MIKIVLALVVVFGLFFFGIQALSKHHHWPLSQQLTYSAICAILTVVLLTALVVQH